MALRAVHTVRRLLAVDAAPVKVIGVRLSASPVVIIEAGIIAGVVLPLILVALFPVSRVNRVRLSTGDLDNLELPFNNKQKSTESTHNFLVHEWVSLHTWQDKPVDCTNCLWLCSCHHNSPSRRDHSILCTGGHTVRSCSLHRENIEKIIQKICIIRTQDECV